MLVSARFVRSALLLAIVLTAMAASPRVSGAQSPPRLVVTRSDGTTMKVFLHTLRRIDLGANELVLVLQDGTSFTIPFSSLRNLDVEPAETAAVDGETRPTFPAIRLLAGFPNPTGRSATLPFEVARHRART